MTVQEWEKDFYGNNVTITTRDNECVIYRIRDDSGDSVLTRFEVYPGIALIYNDVHTDYISIKELVGYENLTFAQLRQFFHRSLPLSMHYLIHFSIVNLPVYQ